ncbi:hypothetical protein LX32DRAFT_400075 [Colletotrichum zoysiae]|uniref:Uncharacterized protein n=1 Tax=Colletotrichum zoysiae TaxID=1216348 RepID=A0AAD9HIL7_9PEZI|nr:hypothetical protein LX32DRAFT_400075 [Colletotrichum zoysiae]
MPRQDYSFPRHPSRLQQRLLFRVSSVKLEMLRRSPIWCQETDGAERLSPNDDLHPQPGVSITLAFALPRPPRSLSEFLSQAHAHRSIEGARREEENAARLYLHEHTSIRPPESRPIDARSPFQSGPWVPSSRLRQRDAWPNSLELLTHLRTPQVCRYLGRCVSTPTPKSRTQPTPHAQPCSPFQHACMRCPPVCLLGAVWVGMFLVLSHAFPLFCPLHCFPTHLPHTKHLVPLGVFHGGVRPVVRESLRMGFTDGKAGRFVAVEEVLLMQVLGLSHHPKTCRRQRWHTVGGPGWFSMDSPPPLPHPLSDSRHPAGCDVSSLAVTPKRPWLGSVDYLSFLLHVFLLPHPPSN